MLKHWYEADDRLVAQCGKMLFVDRLLVKFFKTGHRVLLFSTMTKVLDIMERYLMWRTLGDGVLLLCIFCLYCTLGTRFLRVRSRWFRSCK